MAEKGLKEWCSALLDMIYPRLCEVCGTALVEGEELLCLKCQTDMPLTDLHQQPDNDMHHRLACHAPVVGATAMYKYFKGNPYAALIHKAKYRGRPSIARLLARRYARSIAASGFFNGIDMIIPVPVNTIRRMTRGYNQSEHIATGLSEATSIPVENRLKATNRHSTQTRLNAYQRWLNTDGVFHVSNAEGLDGRHILLVDDVITTGSTLVRCLEALHKAAPSARFSVLTLAIDTIH